MKKMAYTFEEFNGNCGDTYAYMTLSEAMDDAEHTWKHLTAGERRAYLARRNGEVFMVCDSEGNSIRDFLEE